MKRPSRVLAHAGVVTGLLTLAALLGGCRTSSVDEPLFTEVPGLTTPAGDTNLAVPPPAGGELSGRFRVGDMVTVNFSGVSEMIPPHEERIKDDGTITMHLIGSVAAAGKTPGELQKEIQDRYRKYYPNIVVTVKSFELFYYVGGEVRNPARVPWGGEITVTRAIQSVGDFTDFANKTKVQLIRANGTQVTVNCKKAISHPDLDPKVMPGDKIHVPRRWW
jgi:polysaccharide export outer membrane protein